MKRRKVQFSDPPVSDLAEIPRTPSGGQISLKTSLKTKLLAKQKAVVVVDPAAAAAEGDSESCGLYVATPPLVEAPPAVPQQQVSALISKIDTRVNFLRNKQGITQIMT